MLWRYSKLRQKRKQINGIRIELGVTIQVANPEPK